MTGGRLGGAGKPSIGQGERLPDVRGDACRPEEQVHVEEDPAGTGSGLSTPTITRIAPGSGHL